MNYLKSLTALSASALIAMSLFAVPMMANASTALDQAKSNLQAASGDVGTDEDPSVNQLPRIVSNIINVVLSVLGILLFVYFIYGGFVWMTAGGDSKKVDEAKTNIKNATIGLAIILASYAISSFVIEQLITATTTQ